MPCGHLGAGCHPPCLYADSVCMRSAAVNAQNRVSACHCPDRPAPQGTRRLLISDFPGPGMRPACRKQPFPDLHTLSVCAVLGNRPGTSGVSRPPTGESPWQKSLQPCLQVQQTVCCTLRRSATFNSIRGRNSFPAPAKTEALQAHPVRIQVVRDFSCISKKPQGSPPPADLPRCPGHSFPP